MNDLKVCFIGVGSIARRHIRNLREIATEDGFSLTVDAMRSIRCQSDENALCLNNLYYSYSELPDDYDVIFITNPTDMHIETLKAVHDKAKHFFIEKPVTSYGKAESVKDIEYREDSTYYVACPLRYTNVIQYIRNNIDVSDVISVRCISSSYLPDWRPAVDYRTTYSASKALGGGVSIDLIHEWDYIRYLFGIPQKVHYMHGKKSALEIDSDDYAIYIAEYNDKIVELHLDYFGRKPIRQITLFTEVDTIQCDLIGGRISYLRLGTTVDLSEQRDDFQKAELRNFLGMIGSPERKVNYIFEAYETLKLTQGEL